MNTKKAIRLAVPLAVLITLTLTVAACSHVKMMAHGMTAKRPATSEFGLGPRTSSQGRYKAAIQTQAPLAVRKMQTIQVAISDAKGQPIDGAVITVDGGMPQHGHGLPTRPRVTRNLGGGLYEVQGVRFNMGGWWEFKLAIDGAAGADNVTFNLAL